MKIRHESPGSELDWKARAAIFVETPQRETVRIDGWSLSGLDWPKDAPACPKAGILSIPFQGVDIRFPVRLAPMSENRLVQLEGLSGRQRETLALFYRSLLSGRMASSGDVITSLDTPLDLVPMQETEAEISQRPAKTVPKKLRLVVNVMSYVMVSVLVVGIVGNNIFTNLDRIDIQHGRVIAPASRVLATRGGFVQSVEVRAGDVVQAGDVLVRLRDLKTMAELENTEAELEAAQDAYAHANAGLEELKNHSGSEKLSNRMAVASRLYSDFVGKGEFDDIQKQLSALRTYDPEFESQFDPLETLHEMLVSEAELRLAKITSVRATRTILVGILEAGFVTAPAIGVVQEVLTQKGHQIGPEDALFVFKASSSLVAVGWVSERFSETIFVGMPASIGLNENGHRLKMKGVVTDVRASDRPERPGEFGIIVTVTAQNLAGDAAKTRLREGAPVNLEAKRQLGKRLKNWFSQLVARYG